MTKKLRAWGEAHPSIIIIALTIFGYVVLRAILVSFTYDEAYTYMHQAPRSIIDLLTYTSDQPANIHIFMTLGVKLLAALGATSELILRSLSIIAFVVYAACSYLLTRRFKNQVFAIGGFVLLMTNPFVLEFFSLARGYSVSLALMMVGLVFLADGMHAHNPNYKRLIIGLSFAGLAVISNLNWLFIYLGMTIAVATMTLPHSLYIHRKQFFRRVISIIRRNWWLVIANLGLVAYMLFTATKLKTVGALYFGGTTSFLKDTVGSLITATAYGSATTFVTQVLSVIVVAASIYMVGLAIFLIYKHKIIVHRFYFSLLFTLIFMAAGETAAHYILNIPFQTDRTAIAFLPIFIACVSFSLYIGWMEFKAGKVICQILIAVMAVLAIAHLFAVANVSYTYSFKGDASSKIMLETLAGAAVDGKHIRLGVDWEFESAVNFYRIADGMTWLAPVPLQLGLPANQDYYYIGQYSWTHEDTSHWEVVQNFPLTNTMLVKVKN